MRYLSNSAYAVLLLSLTACERLHFFRLLLALLQFEYDVGLFSVVVGLVLEFSVFQLELHLGEFGQELLLLILCYFLIPKLRHALGFEHLDNLLDELAIFLGCDDFIGYFIQVGLTDVFDGFF